MFHWLLRRRLSRAVMAMALGRSQRRPRPLSRSTESLHWDSVGPLPICQHQIGLVVDVGNVLAIWQTFLNPLDFGSASHLLACPKIFCTKLSLCIDCDNRRSLKMERAAGAGLPSLDRPFDCKILATRRPKRGINLLPLAGSHQRVFMNQELGHESRLGRHESSQVIAI